MDSSPFHQAREALLISKIRVAALAMVIILAMARTFTWSQQLTPTGSQFTTSPFAWLLAFLLAYYGLVLLPLYKCLVIIEGQIDRFNSYQTAINILCALAVVHLTGGFDSWFTLYLFFELGWIGYLHDWKDGILAAALTWILLMLMLALEFWGLLEFMIPPGHSPYGNDFRVLLGVMPNKLFIIFGGLILGSLLRHLVTIRRERRDLALAYVTGHQVHDELAFFDGMTGFQNFSDFQNQVITAIDEARSRATRLSLANIDIDYLKMINRCYGMGVGDLAIRAVAKTLGRNRRHNDSLCRYRGGEFYLLLKDTNRERAQECIKRLKDRLDSLRVPHPSKPEVTLPVTVSAALVTLPDDDDKWEVRPGPLETTIYDRVFNMLELTLHACKKGGRNRVGSYYPALVERFPRLELHRDQEEEAGETEEAPSPEPFPGAGLSAVEFIDDQLELSDIEVPGEEGIDWSSQERKDWLLRMVEKVRMEREDDSEDVWVHGKGAKTFVLEKGKEEEETESRDWVSGSIIDPFFQDQPEEPER